MTATLSIRDLFVWRNPYFGTALLIESILYPQLHDKSDQH